MRLDLDDDVLFHLDKAQLWLEDRARELERDYPEGSYDVVRRLRDKLVALTWHIERALIDARKEANK